MQFFFATPKRLHRVHSHFFVIVLGMAEGGFLLPILMFPPFPLKWVRASARKQHLAGRRDTGD